MPMASLRYTKVCIRLASIAVLLLILGPLLTRTQLLPFQFGLLAVALAVVLALIAMLASLWALRRGSESKLLLAVALAAAPLVFAALAINIGRGAPIIHDISTDTQDPPQFVVAPSVRPDAQNSLTYEPANAALQKQAYPDLQTVMVERAPAQAFTDAVRVAQQLGWDIYAQDAAQGRIEAVETTALFRFKDDIVIRIRAHDQGSAVDLRSVSRVGGGDLGANAKRIRRFIAAFQALPAQ
jgi:uncharacterized protein (DUF1499 family)